MFVLLEARYMIAHLEEIAFEVLLLLHIGWFSWLPLIFFRAVCLVRPML